MKKSLLIIALAALLLLSACGPWGDVYETVWVTDETTEQGETDETTSDKDESTTESETDAVLPPDFGDLPDIDPSAYPQYLLCTMEFHTFSPYGKSVGGITFHSSTDAEYYGQGTPIVLTLTLTNTGKSEVTYDVESGIRCVTTGDDPEQWAETVRVTIPAGESCTVELTYETPMTDRLWIVNQIADYEILICLRDPLSEVIRIRSTVPLAEELIPLHSFDEEFTEAVRQAYLAELGEEYADSTVTLRSVASLSSAEILFIDFDAIAYPEVITTETVDGLDFVYSNGQTMTVYYDSTFYDLQSALDMGVLTSDDIAALHEIWCQANVHLYENT